MKFIDNLLTLGGASRVGRTEPPRRATNAIQELTAKIESVIEGIQYGQKLDDQTAKDLLAAYDKIVGPPHELKEKVDVLRALLGHPAPLCKVSYETYETEVQELLNKRLDGPLAKNAGVVLAQILKLNGLSEASMKTAAELQTKVDQFYTEAVEKILDPLRVRDPRTGAIRGYATAKLGRSNMPGVGETFKLFSELQATNLTGGEVFLTYKEELRKVVDGYVGWKFKNSQDQAQGASAIELLSFSRTLNSNLSPLPYERKLLEFVSAYTQAKYSAHLDKNEKNASDASNLLSLMQNTAKAVFGSRYEPSSAERAVQTFLNDYANSRLSRIPNHFEMDLPPVGIPNVDGSICFASSWMQLVANNRLLSKAYKEYFRPGHYARDVLDEYHRVQYDAHDNQQLLAEVGPGNSEEVEELLNLYPQNITRMREAPLIDAGQQDANELANALHNQMQMTVDGTIDGAKFGAKTVRERTDLSTGEKSIHPVSSDRNTEYSFPSLELNFDPKNPNPSLASMMDYTHLNQISDVQGGQVSNSLFFAEVPDVLVYRLARLEGANKNETEVDMPLYHEIVAKNDERERGILQLQGFIQHRGSAKGGHYVSYIVQKEKFWLVNDKKTQEISAADYLVAARHATAAVYSRV